MKLKVVCLALAMIILLMLTGFSENGVPVRVAVIDTGVSTAAIDASNISEGKNYAVQNAGTEDVEGHGTAVSSIIAGSKFAEVEGRCDKAVIVPLVFYTLNESGGVVRCNVNTMAQMMRDAVDVYNCRIINMSSGTDVNSPMLLQASEYAKKKGVLVVSAVGNDGGSGIYYPAAYDSVLCVGSLNSDGVVADFSNHHKSLDIIAPGEGLAVADVSGEQITENGTSFSCAYVSGVAAEIMSEYPELNAFDVRKILISSADDLGEEGFDERSGWGSINEGRAKDFAKTGRIFRDVPEGKWYFDAVNSAARLGIVSGTSEVTFSAEDLTSRAMLWTMLFRLDGNVSSQNDAVWYESARVWAMQKGISDGENPEGKLSREQLATMLFRYAEANGADMQKRAELGKFSDFAEISDYAKDALSWANADGIIGGTGKTTLSPKAWATRAEVAAIMVRFFAQTNEN